MSSAANPARGERAITLDGVDYVLRPSFEAIGLIEGATGLTLHELTVAAGRGGLSSAAIAEVVTQCIRAQGRALGSEGGDLMRFKPATIGGLIYNEPGGFAAALHNLVAPLLLEALTGGYTASGEAKA